MRTAPNVELLAGTILQGTPYAAVYNNTDGAFYLQGFYGDPYNIPLAAGLDYWGSTTPNSCFAFPTGQAISRTTYSALFTIMGTTYGSGDGSTTFNLPDKTGRVSAMIEATPTRLTSTGFTSNSSNMGAAGGTDQETLSLNHLPTGIASNGVNTIPVGPGGAYYPYCSTAGSQIPTVTSGSEYVPWNQGGWSYAQLSSSSNLAVTSNNTGSLAQGGAKNVPTVQPTIICNYIIRII